MSSLILSLLYVHMSVQIFGTINMLVKFRFQIPRLQVWTLELLGCKWCLKLQGWENVLEKRLGMKIWDTLILRVWEEEESSGKLKATVGGNLEGLECWKSSEEGALMKRRSTTHRCCWLMKYLAAQTVNNLPAVQETRVWSLGWEDPLEKGMATHSSILFWRILWTGEPGGLQFMGS